MNSGPKKPSSQDVVASAIAASMVASGGTGTPAPYFVTPSPVAVRFQTQVAAEAARVDRKQVDDIISLAEAKSDTKFERVLGEMRSEFAKLRGEMVSESAKLRGEIGSENAKIRGDLAAVSSKLSNMPTTFQMVTWMLGISVTIGGLIYSVSRLVAS